MHKTEPISDAPHQPPSPEKAWQEFEAFLKRSGARCTNSRRTIVEHVVTRSDHFTADDVAASLSKGARRVSRGTVYRTLALMVECGQLRMIRDSDVHVHYEAIPGHPHHEHMICESCGSFIEFADKRLASILKQACKKKDFLEHSHRIVVSGLCRNCQTKKEKHS